MLRRSILLLGSTLVAVVFLVGALPIMNASAATLSAISGRLYAVNLKTKQVTITTSGTSRVTLGYSISTRFLRNGLTASAKGLVFRDAITARYDASTGMVAALRATGPAVTTVAGRVLNRVQRSGVVTVGMNRVRTNARTGLLRNGQLVSLGALTRRDAAVVHLARGTNVALDVEDDGPDESSVEGTITGISGNSVTITPTDGSAPVTVTVDANTLIEVDDNSATLADLQTGMTAESEYDPTTMVALTIDAQTEGEDQEVEGTVASVDTTNNTITINPSGGGSPVTLNVNAGTEIQVDGEDAMLSDVQAGMSVQAEYDSATMNALEIDAGSSGGGGGD